MQVHLEKLRKDAAEYALLRDLVTDPAKKELFALLAQHLEVLANEVEQAIRKQAGPLQTCLSRE